MLTPLTPLGEFTLTRIPASYVNVRATPSTGGKSLGVLRLRDVATLYAPDENGFVYLTTPTVEGWVSRQNGKVVFTPVAAPPAVEYEAGIDVSVYQRQIDWSKVAASGVVFAYIRAAIGVTGVDEALRFNALGSLSAGLDTGCYAVFKPQLDGKAQAEHFLATIAPYDAAALTPAIDFEIVGADPRLTADRLYGMALELERALGKKPLIYTAQGYFDAAQIATMHDGYLAQCGLFVANYTTADQPAMPRPWKTFAQPWQVWQHSSTGHIDGIGSVTTPIRVDLDRRRKTPTA